MKTRKVNFTRKPTKDENGLNKLEAAWLVELQRRGYEAIGIQNVTLKLAVDCRYTPDFSAIVDGRKVFFECKGFMREDALIKLKLAARLFTEYDFVLVTRDKTGWHEKEIEP